ncbi:hypothetical protein ACJ2_19930 [Pantoea sp. QMID2]|nr:hypothetical protein ACJ3_13310 [Pantoea sp. QMID3]GME34619.1 hypothetical protein ACJ1_13230 [Pantoea sp. QMID1]GME55560.1 hypothetical protein ACJ4_19910 [Pantoea sp. QMID4]GME56606.1 hypothetical protein ACJ2_19930 [Pantoea sp. QMID2]
MTAQGSKITLLQGIKNFPSTDTESREVPRPFQPSPPVTAVRGWMDKITVMKGDLCAGKHCGRTYRDKPLSEEQPALRTLTKMTIPEKNGAVIRLAAEVHLVSVHPDAGDFDPRGCMVMTETIKYVKEPPHG